MSEFERKQYYAIKGSIYRKSLNYPIQGTSGDITKYAGILLFRKILEKDMFNTILIPNIIHDELIIETPINIAEEWAKILQDSMELAGKMFCKIVPLKAEPQITPYWTH